MATFFKTRLLNHIIKYQFESIEGIAVKEKL